MPKVAPKAPAPKAVAKAPVKADASAKAKADKAKLIETASAALVDTIGEFREADEKTKNLFFDLADKLGEVATENGFNKEDSRACLKMAMADAYEVDAESITLEGNPTLYANLSKILTLVFPKDKNAAKNLAKARAKGVTVNNALLIARGKMNAAPVSKGKGKDASGKKATKNGKDIIDDDEVLENEFSAIIARAVKGEYTTDSIGEIFASALANYEDADGDGDGDTE